MLEAHEIATLFPAMSQVDLDHLRESMAREGQLEDILVFEGQILDGRHRYEMCLQLGLAPRLRQFEGTAQEAFAHSVALNLGRRHLTTVQRAAAGAGIKEFQARLLAREAPPAPPAVDAPPLEPAPVEIDVSIEEPAQGDDEPPAEVATDEPAAAPAPAPRAPSARTIQARARELASKQVGVSPRAIDAAAKIKEQAPDVFERMLAGTAGSMPDARRVTALPPEVREKVHALVDEGAGLKTAIRQVSPPADPEDSAVFLGKVTLEPGQARDFLALLEARGLRRADAAREALAEWIERHRGTLDGERKLAVAS